MSDNTKEGFVSVFAPTTGGLQLNGNNEWLNPHNKETKERIKEGIKKGDYVHLTLTNTGAIIAFEVMTPPVEAKAISPTPQKTLSEETKKHIATAEVTTQAEEKGHASPLANSEQESLSTKAPEEFFRPASSDTNTKEVYEALAKISGNITKKGPMKLSYISWADAWTDIKKLYPGAQILVYENGNGMPYFADHTGGFVKVGVTINCHEHVSWLPIMDHYNKTIPLNRITTFDTNKAIQRATVKALAYHGYGLYVFRGEDLPEEDSSENKTK